MDEQQFLEFFTSLFDGLSEEIDMDTEFRYLDEWGSLSGLAFMTEMEDKYHKTFSVPQMRQAETIGDLYKLYKDL